MNDVIRASTVYSASISHTKVDDCVLLRLHTSEHKYLWLRWHHSDFLEFVAYLMREAREMRALQ
jgi:hypothetical protein